MDNYDAPWKTALVLYFEDFVAFYFPDVHAAIDWRQAPEFLDTELQQLAQDGALGRRLADKLVRVHTLDGIEQWVLIHIEVQASHDHQLAQRIFTYSYRIYDRYQHPVASLVVLADRNPNWRPDRFSFKLFGCALAATAPCGEMDADTIAACA